MLAEWDAAAGRLTVKGAAKVPFFNRRTVARMMGLAESAVDLIENDVGGGFGARGEFYPEDFLIPFAARCVGCPVIWIEDRREHLIAINHARQMECEVVERGGLEIVVPDAGDRAFESIPLRRRVRCELDFLDRGRKFWRAACGSRRSSSSIRELTKASEREIHEAVFVLQSCTRARRQLVMISR